MTILFLWKMVRFKGSKLKPFQKGIRPAHVLVIILLAIFHQGLAAKNYSRSKYWFALWVTLIFSKTIILRCRSLPSIETLLSVWFPMHVKPISHSSKVIRGYGLVKNDRCQEWMNVQYVFEIWPLIKWKWRLKILCFFFVGKCFEVSRLS